MSFRFVRRDIEYSKSVQTRLINQSFEPDILPPHILGCSDDFNVTFQRIDQYFNSLLEDDTQEAVEWQQWESLSPMEKDMYQHHITVLKEQRQVMMQTMNDERKDISCGGGILCWTRVEENKLMRALSRGMSYEDIRKRFFKGKGSVRALRLRYHKISTMTTSSHQ
ncbi:hypothetical protein IV203_009597 [Nitzschia inconspicua]|uniref:Uncharacterized protein n=1 Tax=Nitzschia inconspicua TaxID=303405 RepID=A0A9K3KUZ1_9STRA|nr:hypothetical protein IV203_009597 [Nitzschia inconspicua]